MASTQNILYASKFIETPFEALGLLLDSISNVFPLLYKSISLSLVCVPYNSHDPMFGSLTDKYHISCAAEGLYLDSK